MARRTPSVGMAQQGVCERRIPLLDVDPLALLGTNDSYLQLIEQRLGGSVVVRGNTVILRGEASEVQALELLFQELLYLLRRNGRLSPDDVAMVIDLVTLESCPSAREGVKGEEDVIFVGRQGPVRARTAKQLEYWQKVRTHDIVFAIGPAGTGKTYLAVAMALAALRHGEVARIILSRPAVEAGESLGFLPGDLYEKVDPYLRPLMDALIEMLGADKLRTMMERRTVEVIPLAYMRGRTLSNAFLILDEAQNTTIGQMKMFLTRLGRNSKAIVTGDITQIDLGEPSASGLVDVQAVLKNVPGIAFVYFDRRDVVRHHLVASIIEAYEQRQRQVGGGVAAAASSPSADTE
ncbi:MAG: PhoH family protein [Candidatus Kapabacteria bacterium]|nr:PhoH family protein [Candidatus Kapabacteria bacterium]MDW8012695.1 PhoH family protein [Bacteroidota bacterium]